MQTYWALWFYLHATIIQCIHIIFIYIERNKNLLHLIIFLGYACLLVYCKIWDPFRVITVITVHTHLYFEMRNKVKFAPLQPMYCNGILSACLIMQLPVTSLWRHQMVVMLSMFKIWTWLITLSTSCKVRFFLISFNSLISWKTFSVL